MMTKSAISKLVMMLTIMIGMIYLLTIKMVTGLTIPIGLILTIPIIKFGMQG